MMAYILKHSVSFSSNLFISTAGSVTIGSKVTSGLSTTSSYNGKTNPQLRHSTLVSRAFSFCVYIHIERVFTVPGSDMMADSTLTVNKIDASR